MTKGNRWFNAWTEEKVELILRVTHIMVIGSREHSFRGHKRRTVCVKRRHQDKNVCVCVCETASSKHQFLPVQTATQPWSFTTKTGSRGFFKKSSFFRGFKCWCVVDVRRKRSFSYVFLKKTAQSCERGLITEQNKPSDWSSDSAPYLFSFITTYFLLRSKC